MKKIVKIVVSGVAGFAPMLAFATTIKTDLVGLMTQINGIINIVIPFIVGLGVLVIIWGVFNYVAGAGDEEKRAQAKQFIIWGIIGIFVMLSVWGLVNVLVSSFTLDKRVPATPTVGF